MTKQTFCLAVERSLSFKNWEVAEPSEDLKLQPPSLKIPANFPAPQLELPQKEVFEFQSPRPAHELNEAATKLQKVYKSYRTRRNLADCAVVLEELWWKALDFETLRRASVSFFNVEKPEPAVSKWARAKKRLARVGKGLSKNEKAQKLALRHWLEAQIDPRHRYGHNLHLYYDVWFASESTQPFFYWLDVGDGREVNLQECSRIKLQKQCITYLGPIEREAYEVIVEDGKLVYKMSETLVNTTEGSKWIFVLSTSRSLYVGKKMKGTFQHSSFLAGGATTAAGRLVAQEGTLQAIWPYSGHYLPTEDNFNEFINFLEDNEVDLTNVKRCSVDDDDYTSTSQSLAGDHLESAVEAVVGSETGPRADVGTPALDLRNDAAADGKATPSPLARRESCKWATGAGARISCVRDYPVDLQSLALEQVNLSPRVSLSPAADKFKAPIPSPRPSPKLRLSPRLQRLAILTPAAPPSPRRSPKVRPSPREH